ncbi:hypothetical protein SADUNF_Sadunf11G0068200 [Salix dunnii]|uniref:FCP1 homology domain-containing protein n=1 Tax=Salix dunnii TaxID=1413687 RepID=A0A835JQB3_9ROSI|nr:hypothetical protein SADUNF_Sadunf11G0068200 [Salix dunnii]
MKGIVLIDSIAFKYSSDSYNSNSFSITPPSPPTNRLSYSSFCNALTLKPATLNAFPHLLFSGTPKIGCLQEFKSPREEYAYSLYEVEEKTKTWRESVNYTAGNDASNVEVSHPYLLLSKERDINRFISICSEVSRLLYTTVTTVELYFDLRKLQEDHVKATADILICVPLHLGFMFSFIAMNSICFMQGFTEPTSDKLLPDLHLAEQHVFTLVLDLDETIIYTRQRLANIQMTSSRCLLATSWTYVDLVVERLDTNHFIRYRLSRSATKYQDGKHYRLLNRDPGKILYVSGHAFENSLQLEYYLPIKPFKMNETGDVPLDTALLDLILSLEYVARNNPSDIRMVLASDERKDVGKEFLECSKDYQRYCDCKNRGSKAASGVAEG